MARVLVLTSFTQKREDVARTQAISESHEQAKSWAHWCQSILIPGPAKLPQPFSPLVSTFLPICFICFSSVN